MQHDGIFDSDVRLSKGPNGEAGLQSGASSPAKSLLASLASFATGFQSPESTKTVTRRNQDLQAEQQVISKSPSTSARSYDEWSGLRLSTKGKDPGVDQSSVQCSEDSSALSESSSLKQQLIDNDLERSGEGSQATQIPENASPSRDNAELLRHVMHNENLLNEDVSPRASLRPQIYEHSRSDEILAACQSPQLLSIAGHARLSSQRSVSAPVRPVALLPSALDGESFSTYRLSGSRKPHATQRLCFLQVYIRPNKVSLTSRQAVVNVASHPRKLSTIIEDPFIVKEAIEPLFDDASLFRALNKEVSHLLGYAPRLGARTLRKIKVHGATSRAADLDYGWIRSPRSLERDRPEGFFDFTEDQLLRHFRDPALGKDRFAWVAWARRLAMAVEADESGSVKLPIRSPLLPRPSSMLAVKSPVTPKMDKRPSYLSPAETKEDVEGLEFVLAWSIWPILIVIASILFLSLAATLLWIWLGPEQSAGALGRVASGCGIGLTFMGVGLVIFMVWVGLSWLLL